jgi:hypothetical protein
MKNMKIAALAVIAAFVAVALGAGVGFAVAAVL